MEECFLMAKGKSCCFRECDQGSFSDRMILEEQVRYADLINCWRTNGSPREYESNHHLESEPPQHFLLQRRRLNTDRKFYKAALALSSSNKRLILPVQIGKLLIL